MTLAVVAVSMVLLSFDRIPRELSSVAIVVMLVLAGVATPGEALAGFSSETTVFIFALLALTQGLASTGVMQLAGRRLLALAHGNRLVFVALLLTTVCVFSAFASNTAVTAAFLPVTLTCAAQLAVPPARLLMPVAFASILGGTITLFGTSTNLVVSAEMADLGMRRLGFLELAPLGVPLAVVGVAVTLVLARRLRGPSPDDALAALPGREYLTEAVLTPGSRFVGKDLQHVSDALGVPALAIVRSGEALLDDPREVLDADDHLLVAGTLDDVLRVKDLRSVALRPDRRYADGQRAGLGLLEVSVPATSSLVGRSVRELRFAERYGLLVLGLHRHPGMRQATGEADVAGTRARPGVVRDIPLAAGDVLLVSGRERRLQELARDDDFAVLGPVEYERPRYHRAWLALALFSGVIVVAALGLTSAAVAGLAGLLAMVATGCVSSAKVFRVDWRVLLMIGAMLALGRAMESSGAGAFLSQAVVPLAELAGPRGVLVAMMVATLLLSIPMSNQAAALLMLPVAVHAASALQLDARTFAVGTCLSASLSFLTPLEPSAALVYGPGRYRFTDFLRIGGPLTALLLALLAFGVPLFWPFTSK